MSNIPVNTLENLNELFVTIEIPEGSYVKYEWDDDTHSMVVDRFLPVPMPFPCNYGFLPNTLGGDGDALDVLVITPKSLIPMAKIPCRAIGVLEMEDEGGEDHKILMLPTQKLTKEYDNIQSMLDMERANPMLLQKIRYFFNHYKDLEIGKWVRLKEGWGNVDRATLEVKKGIERFNLTKQKEH